LPGEDRVLTLADIERELALSAAQVRTLIARGDLPAMRILGVWRVERRMLEQFIGRAYDDAATFLDATTPEPPAAPGTEPAPAAEPVPGADAGEELTGQQRRVLALVGDGLSNREIADLLSVEPSTVKSHVSGLLQRLGLRDRQQLTAYAWRHGILPPAE
jgi:DNA-binding NarL/FixJ family response regulator